MPHEYLGLGDIQRAEPATAQLFDTLYVLQNFDADDRVRRARAPARHHGVASVDATHYPLNLVVTPGDAARG